VAADTARSRGQVDLTVFYGPATLRYCARRLKYNRYVRPDRDAIYYEEADERRTERIVDGKSFTCSARVDAFNDSGIDLRAGVILYTHLYPSDNVKYRPSDALRGAMRCPAHTITRLHRVK